VVVFWAKAMLLAQSAAANKIFFIERLLYEAPPRAGN
jgi:hypothetical protein